MQQLSCINFLNQFDVTQAQQDVYANVELSGFSDGGDDEARILELKQKALLVDIVHHVHIVEDLIESQVSSLQDWAWQKQLRFENRKTKKKTFKKMDFVYCCVVMWP